MFEKFKENRKIATFEKHWINIMANLGLYNKLKQTFSLNDTTITYFGYKSKILIVDGLSFDKLDSVKETIEDNLGCMAIFNKPKRSNVAYAEFVFSVPSELKFAPLAKLKPTDIYIGNDYAGNPIIIDMIKYPHILISGGTRSGKK